MDFLSFLTPRSGLLALIVVILGTSSFRYAVKPGIDDSDLPVADKIMRVDIDKPIDIVSTKPQPKPKPKPKRVDVVRAKSKAKLKPKPDPRVLFFKNFKNYDQGDLVNWGDNLVIKKRSGKKWVSSQMDGVKMLTIPLDFPVNWTFSFESRLDCAALTGIVFVDDWQNSLQINTRHKGFCWNPMTIRLPNGVSAVTPFDIQDLTAVFFEFSWIKNVLKVRLNGTVLVTGRFTGFGAFRQIRLSWGLSHSKWQDSNAFFTNFKLYDMTSPEEAKLAATASKIPTSPYYPIEPPDWLKAKGNRILGAYSELQSEIFRSNTGNKAAQERLQSITLSYLKRVTLNRNPRYHTVDNRERVSHFVLKMRIRKLWEK